MVIEYKTIVRFDKYDLIEFNKWKKENNLSLRKISKETGISHSYIDEMIKGKKAINERFGDWLLKNNCTTFLVVRREIR